MDNSLHMIFLLARTNMCRFQSHYKCQLRSAENLGPGLAQDGAICSCFARLSPPVQISNCLFQGEGSNFLRCEENPYLFWA